MTHWKQTVSMVLSLVSRGFHLLLGGFTALMGVGSFLWGFHRLRLTVFALSRHPHYQGRVITQGLARPTDPQQVHMSPLSESPCIAYQFSILESRSGVKGGRSQSVLYQDIRGQWNLSLQTPRGIIPIQSCELDFDRASWQDTQTVFRHFAHPRSVLLLAEHGINPQLARWRRSLTLSETLIRDGDPIRVIGRMQSHPPRLAAAIVTDKSDRRILLEATLACLIGAGSVWIALAILAYAWR
jgi:hypothetical protein